MKKSRLFVAVIFIAAIGWLIISPKDLDRKDQINQSLKNHQLGKIADSDSRKLTNLLMFYKSYLHIPEPICLNCAIDSHEQLRFYTCDPGQFNLTDCAEGNAIYDRELNAVFIDKSLVLPDAWVASGVFGSERKKLPFLEVYLKFILLHELGHYFLHRNVKIRFDVFSGNTPEILRRYESQADSFAVSNFTRIVDHDTSNVLFNEDIFENLALDNDPTASSMDKTLLCLTLMARDINLGMLFGVSPYSEFYTDKAHPTFISRSVGFINQALMEAPVKDKYYGKAEWIGSLLGQLEKIAATYNLLEIRVPAPILDVGFTPDGILVPTMDSSLYRTDYPQSNWPAGPGVKVASAEKVAANKVYFDFDMLYSFRAGQVFSGNEQQILTFSKGHWNPAGFILNAGHTYSNIVLQQQPSDSVAYLDGDTYSYAISAGGILQKIGHTDMGQQTDQLSGLSNTLILWDQALVLEPNVYLMVLQKNGLSWRLAGMIVIDMAQGRLRKWVKLNLDDSRLSELTNHFDPYNSRVLYNPENGNYFLLSSQIMGKPNVKMELWQLSAAQKPRFTSERYFISDTSLDQKPLDIEPKLYPRSVAYLSGDTYVCNWDDDMIYRVGLNKGSIAPVFHFGASTIRIRTSKNGVLAIFSPQSAKFYLMRP